MQYLEFVVKSLSVRDNGEIYGVAYHHHNGDMVTFVGNIHWLYSEFVNSVDDYYEFEEYLIDS